MLSLPYLIFLISSSATILVNANFTDYTVLRISTTKDSIKDDLRRLDGLLGYRIDYLRQVRCTGRPAEMLVLEKDLGFVREYLDQNGIANELLTTNMSHDLRRERRALIGPVEGEITYELIQKKYLSFDDQMALLLQLAKRFPQLVDVWQVATSYEGRSIYAIKIGYPSTVKKPILWIDAGIHAREWIAHSTALNIIWQFVHDFSYKRLLHEMDIIVVPNTNPDGYEYSRETNRMWRKTRSRSTASRFSEQCSGVDANRNYPFHFGEEGVSHWPCQEIYCGRVALSEPEVMGLAAAILEKKDQIRGYIALHSFGQDILYPWGHKVHVYPPDVEDLKSMAKGIAAAIQSVYGTRYLVSNSADGLYPASGAADDWAKSIGIKYSFTFELSPTQLDPGFLLPESHISRVGRETMEGVAYMANRLRAEEAGRLLNDIISSRPIKRRTQATRGGFAYASQRHI
ncbi:hypothetical protein RB195_012689 [Necator americanus]|uniref:Peptidase M14 domain-containing protein n=1 Tax=Necator americanus TaxID=51031 RepID=A0ABR1DS33_NECAM